MCTTESDVLKQMSVRRPSDSERAVVFRGDGEPKTPGSILNGLAEIEGDGGLEADSYSRGGAVDRLEQQFAEMLRKEAAIFMPTGTLANHLAIRKHCGGKSRAVVQEQCHVYHDTGDCVTRLSGIHLIPLAKDRSSFSVEELAEVFEQSEDGRVSNPIGAVMIESPVRRQMGQIVTFDQIKAITDFCRTRAVPTHLDGARLYMMCAATGISPKAYAACFDTVYVSLYKYFGAPFGAILAGTSAFIEDLYHDRRMFGGGLALAWMAAALALRGIEGFAERLAAAMAQATALFERLNTLPGIAIGQFEHGSNMFPVVLEQDVNVETFVGALQEHEIFVAPGRDEFYLTVNTTLLRQTNDNLFDAFKASLK
ncbi:MAG: aminotransferase class I/II-fold pyridoxal phosphate-dependent enzyme [bacterium]|nr:aminotransferase class I/II-fold pyridoxal phosphate-dependent enzyme [bacterium]